MVEYNNRILLKGNEAAVYGALLANCDCFFGYPITPASEIAHTAARLFPKLKRVFVQAESEIGAINMVIGAAAMGKRAMTGSSGLGISLKQEAVSYLAAYELPAVILDITRSGPGLGNIGPEQSDYFQVVKGGGHGGYRCLVFTPDSVQEMCDMTMLAFDLAEKYRMPAYVMADGVIGQMMESLTLPEPLPPREDSPWALNKKDAEGNANMLTTIYLEHDELEEVSRKLHAKYEKVKQTEQRAENYLTGDAEVVLCAYGVAARVARRAVDVLRKKGIKAGLVRPLMVFPFPENALKDTLSHARAIVAVELSAGQLIEDVKLAVECRVPVSLCCRYGGNIPSVAEICAEAENALKGCAR